MIELLQYWKQIESIVGENKGMLILVLLWIAKETYPCIKQTKADFITIKTEVHEIKKQVELIADFVIDKEGEKVAKRIRKRRTEPDEPTDN